MEYMRGDQKEAFDEGEPLQLQEAGPVVGQQYCTQKAAQFRLENAIFTKDWTITNSNGDVVFRVQGNLVDWYKAKRELVDFEGKPVVLMEEKVSSCCHHKSKLCSEIWSVRARLT